MTLAIHPLTPDRWNDFEAVFNARGCSVARGCWCMFYRQSGAAAPLRAGLSRVKALHASFREVVDSGAFTGLLAYRDGEPAGWISFGPRAAYRKLANSRVMKAVDERPVWSIVCFVVPSAHRGQGVAHALLDAAIAHARQHRVTLEAYPVDRVERSDESMWFGAMSMYARAGFAEVARRKPERPVVRLEPVSTRDVGRPAPDRR
jgi:GNAT superfamily N-acetyltransferase